MRDGAANEEGAIIETESRRYLWRLISRVAETDIPDAVEGTASEVGVMKPALAVSVDADSITKRRDEASEKGEALARSITADTVSGAVLDEAAAGKTIEAGSCRHILTSLYRVVEARVHRGVAGAFDPRVRPGESLLYADSAPGTPASSTFPALASENQGPERIAEVPIVSDHANSTRTQGNENSADAAAGSYADAKRYAQHPEGNAALEEALKEISFGDDVRTTLQIHRSLPADESQAVSGDTYETQRGLDREEDSQGIAGSPTSAEELHQMSNLLGDPQYAVDAVQTQETSREGAAMATGETKEVKQSSQIDCSTGHSAVNVRDTISIKTENLEVVAPFPSKVEAEMDNFMLRHKEALGEESSGAEALWPVEARASMNPLGLSSPHRPTHSFFRSRQEERLAVAASAPQGGDVSQGLAKPVRSPRRPVHRLLHYSLQEARVALGVDKQLQVEGSLGSSSTVAGVSGDGMSPRTEELTNIDPDSSEGIGLPPKPPASAPGKRRPVGRRLTLRAKHGVEAHGEALDATPWSPLRGIESTARARELLAALGPLQQISMESDSKRGIALLEATLVKVTPEGKSPRDLRPPSRHNENTPRRKLTFPVKTGEEDTPQHHPELTNGKRGTVMAGAWTNNLRSSVSKVDDSSSCSEAGAWQLKITLDTIRSMLGASDSEKNSRPVSRGWSPDWTVQNSAPFKFRLPVDVLQKPPRQTLCEEANLGDSQDQDEEDASEPEVKIPKQELPESEPTQQEVRFEQGPTKQEVAPQKSPRKHVAWLPRLRPVRAPASSILPKRPAKYIPAAETTSTTLEESCQEASAELKLGIC